MTYRTPKGLDEGLVPTPPRFLEYDKARGIKTYKYGHTLWARGGNYTTEIIDEFLRRRNNNESIVITVTGPPGSGKTYFGMRFAQKLDRKFHINDIPAPAPNEDSSQLAFGREHLSYLTGPKSPIKRDQVVVLDESHFGVGARSWQDSDQQELTNYIAAIRSKGYVLVIVVLHTEMIDKLIRNFVVNYEFFLAKRGEAIVYRRFFPQYSTKVFKKRLGKMQLMMPDEDLCNWGSCLRCEHLKKGCMTIRAIYERRKADFLSQRSVKHDEDSELKRKSAPERFKEKCDQAIPIRESFKVEGEYATASIQYNMNVNRATAQGIRKFLITYDLQHQDEGETPKSKGERDSLPII